MRPPCPLRLPSPFHTAQNLPKSHAGHLQCRRRLFQLPDWPSFSPLGGVQPDQEQRYSEQKVLPYSQRQLYDIVADVNNYYRFVPYCLESKVLTTETREGGTSSSKARLTVGFLAFKESYVSEVACTPYSSVEAVAASGTPLFKKLVTKWHVSPAGRSADEGPSLLSIDLAFAFANPIYAAASSTFFKQVSGMMVQAFERRCEEVYGRSR